MSKKSRRKRWWKVVVIMLVAVFLAVRFTLPAVRWIHHRRGQETTAQPDVQPTDPDSDFRRLVVGTWTDNYQGKRTMTLNEDGTGTMVVELSGWRAALSAPRLRFDMVWSVEGGHLKKRTVGGEPAAQVQMILATMGDRVDEPILELTADRLLLLDHDGKTKYDWQRVKR
jgi:hypothetical protein